MRGALVQREGRTCASGPEAGWKNKFAVGLRVQFGLFALKLSLRGGEGVSPRICAVRGLNVETA